MKTESKTLYRAMAQFTTRSGMIDFDIVTVRAANKVEARAKLTERMSRHGYLKCRITHIHAA